MHRGEDALSAQGDRNRRGVDRDPAPAPALGDQGGGAGAAGRVEDQIARIGRHQETAFNRLLRRLNNVVHVARRLLLAPEVVDLFTRHFVLVVLPPQRSLCH